jgi:O-antigen/teichoic acid export membrane protein
MILYPAYVGLIVLLWSFGWARVSAFAGALLIASAAAAVYCLFHALRSFRLAGALFPPLRIVRQGLQYGLARAVETLYLYADRALLLWLLDVRELGLYTAALAASGVINSLATGSGMVTFTIAARSEDRSGSERVSEIFRAVALVWLVLGGVLILMMPYAVPLVFGRDYMAAVGPAILLIPGSALAGLFALLEQTLRGQGRAFLGVQGRLAGLAVMVPISYLGSTLWEIRGVCLAFIVAQGISLLVLIVHTRRHYGRAFSIRSLVPTLADARKMTEKVTAQARIMLRRQN